jgi:hypothetical protein
VGQLDTTTKRISNTTGVTLTARNKPEKQGHQDSASYEEKRTVELAMASTLKSKSVSHPKRCVRLSDRRASATGATCLQATIRPAPIYAHRPVSATIPPEPTASGNAR